MPADRKQILLAEEDPTLLDVTAFRLELLGYEVVTFGSGAAALNWLGANVPDLLAIGHLADVEPLDLLNRTSDDPRLSDTAVLVLSANSDLEQVQRAYTAGADEYVLTPYDPLVLEKKIERLLAAAALAGTSN